MSLAIAVVEPGRDPYVKRVEPDGEGSYLRAFQREVGGYIEPFDVLFDQSPSIYVNDDGIAGGLAPNRAVYANERMEEVGYLSQMDYETVVSRGDLYTILFGTFIAVSYGEDGEARDITADELERVNGQFAGARSRESAVREILRVRPEAELGER